MTRSFNKNIILEKEMNKQRSKAFGVQKFHTFHRVSSNYF